MHKFDHRLRNNAQYNRFVRVHRNRGGLKRTGQTTVGGCSLDLTDPGDREFGGYGKTVVQVGLEVR